MGNEDSGLTAGLLAQASALDGDLAATAPEAIEAAQAEAAALSMADQNSQAVFGIFELALPIVGEAFPSLNTIYTEEARGKIAAVLGPLLAKYGINVHEVGGRYKEELAAGFVCVPIAIATYKGIKADIAAREPAPKAVAQPAKGIVPPACAPPKASTLKPGDYGYTEAGEAGIPA
jgi:hypothetical protein